jgi:hypothetical protein
MILPNNEKAVPVSSTISPVTHVAEVAVNAAFITPILLPVGEAIGRESMRVPKRIVTKKLIKIILAG